MKHAHEIATHQTSFTSSYIKINYSNQSILLLRHVLKILYKEVSLFITITKII
jgi:hypothetical protein